MTERTNQRRTLIGIVLSDKMNKTRVVQIAWQSKHSKYEKQIRHFIKYKSHDENNEAKLGDTVEIMESRPLSKDKRWVIIKIIKKNVEQ
ncbi:MAG: 30S ribosomal protein S17 [Candidatus Omnitrophota bacterium]